MQEYPVKKRRSLDNDKAWSISLANDVESPESIGLPAGGKVRPILRTTTRILYSLR